MRKFFSTEYAKLKGMTFTEIRQYIWEYYKLHFLAIGIGAFIVGGLINIWFINPPKQEYLYIPWEAEAVPPESLVWLSEELSAIVPNQERYRVLVRSYVLGHDQRTNQSIVASFRARLSVGDIHAVITTRDVIQENSNIGLLRHMGEVIAIIQETNPSFYEEISERLLTITYTVSEGHDITDIMAISLKNAPLLTRLGFETDDLYLGIIANSWHFDRIARALAVIFEEGI